MSANMRRPMSISELEDRIDAVELAQTDNCREIVGLAGLDFVRDLRFGDFTECNFDGQKLWGFNLTGCDLRGSTFDGAWIDTVDLDCAMFDPGALQKAADYDAFLKRDLGRDSSTRYRVDGTRLRDLAVFREAPFAPEMVVIPAGEFMMGSNLADDEAYEDEVVTHEDEFVPVRGNLPMRIPGPFAIGRYPVTFNEFVLVPRKRVMQIPRRFAIGRYPVTFEEYDVFCDIEGREKPKDREWGRQRRPVIHISWDDAQAYVAWLNRTLGSASYRLPSEPEWEYACRAGTNTARWWGDAWDVTRANGDGSIEGGRTSPVDLFLPNDWKLHDMIGNIWEWCADADKMAKPSTDTFFGPQGQKRQTKSKKTKKQSEHNAPRILRGGAWFDLPHSLHSAVRSQGKSDYRGDTVGFRLCRTL
jgi:formylglycine-generating enzyme required for sulfatase activity